MHIIDAAHLCAHYTALDTILSHLFVIIVPAECHEDSNAMLSDLYKYRIQDIYRMYTHEILLNVRPF